MKPTDELKKKVETNIADSRIEIIDEEIENVTGGIDAGNNYDTPETLETEADGKATYTRAPRVTPGKSRFKR